MSVVTVDPEFQSALCPLRPEELERLEASLLDEGCREPLIVWDGILIDGHNRHAICTKHDIHFDIDYREFENRDAAFAWMEDNQLGRRNLTPDQFKLLLGRKYNRQKAAHGGDRKSNRQSDGLNDTAEKVAADHGVSSRTVERAGKTAEAIDTAAIPEVRQAAERGDVSVSAAADVATLPPDEQQEIVKAGPAAVRDAAKAIREGKHVHVSSNSGNDEWYTPPEFIESARLAMGSIDTDPASCDVGQSNVQAVTYFTKDDNGLEREWTGNVWLNPPYSKELISGFIAAACEKYETGEFDSACVLVNNATETSWGQTLLSASSAACFVNKRIKYLDSTGTQQKTGLQGQMVCYLGSDVERFADAFSQHGVVLTHG